MKKRKIISSLLITLCIVNNFIACSNKTNNNSTNSATSITKLSETQKTEIMNEVKTFSVDSENTITDLEKIISKNIKNVDDSDKEVMIDCYLSELYSTATDLQEKLSILGYEIEDVLKNDNVDINNKKTYKNISDKNGTVKGFLSELQEKGFTLKFDEESKYYYIQIDYQNVIDKYGKYLNKSYKEFLTFTDYINKNTKSLYDEKYGYNIDEITKRILMIEKGISISKENQYYEIDKWIDNLYSYYELLLGINHDYFISTEYLDTYIYDKYKDIIDKNKDSQLANILNACITIFDESNKKVDTTIKTKLKDILKEQIYTEEINKAINS